MQLSRDATVAITGKLQNDVLDSVPQCDITGNSCWDARTHTDPGTVDGESCAELPERYIRIRATCIARQGVSGRVGTVCNAFFKIAFSSELPTKAFQLGDFALQCLDLRWFFG